MKVQQGEKQKQVELKATCAACSLPIRNNTKGSITSWLFGSRCTCKSQGNGRPNATEEPTGTDANPDSADNTQESAAEILPDLGEQYEVLEFIKEGGMGRVYKVRDKKLNAILAIKLIRKELQLEKGALKRFEQEVSILQKLTHINIAPVYGVGTTDSGVPFVAMEYLDGESLEDVLAREERISVERTFDLAIQICEALSHAHAKGIVHRDLKPSNIIITKTSSGAEIAHIIDFGVARLQSVDVRQSQNLTRTGDVFGSPMYMSPEQCLGVGQDERSDVYSLGCILFEMITGHPPFQGSNAVQTIVQHLNELPIWKTGNADVQGIVNRCLQKVPDDRYQTVEDLQRDLLSIQRGAKVKKRRTKSKSPPKRMPFFIGIFVVVYAVFGISVWSFVSNFNDASHLNYRIEKIRALEQKLNMSTVALEYAITAYPVMDKAEKSGWTGAFKRLADEIHEDCNTLIKSSTSDASKPFEKELEDAAQDYMRAARVVSVDEWKLYSKPNEKEFKHSDKSIRKVDSKINAAQRANTDVDDQYDEFEDPFTTIIKAFAKEDERKSVLYAIYKSEDLDQLIRELHSAGNDLRLKIARLRALEEEHSAESSASPKFLKESIAATCIVFLFLHIAAFVWYFQQLMKGRFK